MYDKKNNRINSSLDVLASLLDNNHTYSYDVWGRLQSVTFANGQTLTYRYNGDGLYMSVNGMAHVQGIITMATKSLQKRM